LVTNIFRAVLVLTVLQVAVEPAPAQSLYVAGGVGADVSLVSGQESIGLSHPPGGGEAFSGAMRLGVLLEPRWGIELEVSRAGEVSDQSNFGPIPIARPIFLPEIESRRRITTVSATASIRQQVSDTVALAYLGGVVFHRTDSRVDYRGLRGIPVLGGVVPGVGFSFGDFSFNDVTSPVGIALPSSSVESVLYGAGPVVGFEAHIRYGEHFLIVPGVRMHGLPASWLLRPSVAAGWNF
jgi:hypothetical protein